MIVRLALPTPLPTHFDYLPPPDWPAAGLSPGIRLRVPFGRRELVGMLLAVVGQSDLAADKLKPALQCLDQTPLFGPTDLTLIQWASTYYHHALGEVLFSALPPALRQAKPAIIKRPLVASARPSALEAKLALNPDQHQAVAAIIASLSHFQAFLLDGVTGSGKTEVYLHAIDAVLTQGQQALILVPEITLTPQLISRFQRRFAVPMVALHSGLTPQQRQDAWLYARSGEAKVVIGTRSAVFTPLANPGIFIVDEEHDLSFKQQDRFRYSARDILIKRGQLCQVPVVMGSATPALETWYNAQQRRYQHLLLPQRAGNAIPPQYRVVDLTKMPAPNGLSAPLLAAMTEHLARQEQVLLFLNQRGFAPATLCHECGWVAHCARCDRPLILHQRRQVLLCHHCGSETQIYRQCQSCGSVDLRAVGIGTERLEAVLQSQFADTPVVRVDRDSTRAKGALTQLLQQIKDDQPMILVGTQMLAKGHHFPNVTLVGILNIDQGLFSSDFRASERMAQLILQVSGRAGRAHKPGQVLLQTHQPQHPLLMTLLNAGYAAFAQAALNERQEAGLPPFSYLALMRAEAYELEVCQAFLAQAKQAASPFAATVYLLGPVPAPMEKRAGRFRAQLLIQAATRAELHVFIQQWQPLVALLPGVRKVRWSLDIDPLDMG